MSTPAVPPRPQQRTERIAAEHDAAKLPEIPPRPTSKRAISPASFSPLNEPYNLSRRRSNDPIQRPPSVARFPTSGEEGMEYGEVQYQPVVPSSALAADAAAQTRSVDKNLTLHAPKPSLPTASATAQVQAVTRTDAPTAVGHGVGRSPSQDGEPLGRTRSRASFSRPDSAASGDRRRSIYGQEHEHGPAELGIRVPINPLLGDVQAPSPGPGLSPHHTGEKKRNHTRTRSGRETLPPGSYGLHGHGIASEDKFERDWYAKHPEELEHEEGQGHGVYESIGSGRGAFAMSHDDLNKIVRDTASRGHGFGTTGNVMSYPDEQIGYVASEQYQSRNTTPALHKVPSNTVPESPLRKANFPEDKVAAASLSGHEDEQPALTDDVHVDEPARKFNKITGGEGTLRERDEVRSHVSHPTSNDQEYSVPILADDELAKAVGYEHLQPAVSPVHHRRGSGYDDYEHGSPHTSRPSSRPGSIYNMHSASHSLTRFVSHHESTDHLHTPLEDVDEYEPLFPEDDEKKKEALSMAERFKRRPDALRHKFPSQDIWEDTPNSAMYEATVSTPDLTTTSKLESTGLFETPEAEGARKGEPSEKEKQKLIPAEERLAKSKFAPHLRDDMPTRPGMMNRFPSQDVWEDSPDSQYLVTTVNAPEDEDTTSPVESKPTVPARPAKSRLGEGASSAQVAPSVLPNVPARSDRTVHAVPPPDAKLTDTSVPPTGLKKVPSIPDRPKPQIPARPAKKTNDEAPSNIPTSSAAEGSDSITSPPLPKAKPQIPARPAGGKIAAVSPNYLNELNQKLGLGPPKMKEPEPEVEPEEVKPLEDARKGRARGPQRRAPAKSPSAAPAPTSSFSISIPKTVFSIDHTDSLLVSTLKAQSRLSEDKFAQVQSSTPADSPIPSNMDATSKTALEHDKASDSGPQSKAPSLATNTAGESADPGTASAEPIASHGNEDMAGSAEPKEPMTEKDVNYGKLEEMTASADGKAHAAEEGSTA